MKGKRVKKWLAFLTALTMMVPSYHGGTLPAYADVAQKEEKVLQFDCDPEENKGDLFHGSTGFLYGVSEVNVPSADLLAGVAPKILVQKAADGMQHPSGDGYRITPYLKACGVENIQIYLQDYYLQWPYESKGIDDYNEKVKKIVTKMVQGKSEAEIASYSFVLFNEPNAIWYQNNLKQLCEDWQKIYHTVKEINPSIKVAGPNFSQFEKKAYEQFFKYCSSNDCLPEYITWHELNKNSLASFQEHCQQVRDYIDMYYEDFTPQIFVNETVNFDDVGNPGALINWLSIFEEEDVYASLPYWGLANSMNELAADANKPNGAWWVYHWYAQMTGKEAPLTLVDADAPGPYGRLYGLTSVDESKNRVYSLFGGQAGDQKIELKNIKSTGIFKNADKAHVKIVKSKYTGHHGFADEIPVEFEGNVAFSGNNLELKVTDADLMDGYFAVVTPEDSNEVTAWGGYKKTWTKTYEAEKAEMIGNAQSYEKTGGGDLARSGRAEVGSMNSEEDGVAFHVDVPEDGDYRLNIYYSSQAPQVDPITLAYTERGGQNRAIGALAKGTLTVDQGASQEIVYDSTVKWGYYNYKTIRLHLTKGEHELKIMYKGEDQNAKELGAILCTLLDKIDLTRLTGAENSVSIDAAEIDDQGSFYVNVPEDGYYQFKVNKQKAGAGAADKIRLFKSRVNYGETAEAEAEVTTDWIKVSNDFQAGKNSGGIYLAAGVNHLRIEGAYDQIMQMTVTRDVTPEKDKIFRIEAEKAQLSGTDAKDGYTYLKGSSAVPEIIDNVHASGQRAVEGFRGGKDNRVVIKVKVPKEGDYKLSVFYANNEPAPVMKTENGTNYVHPYNTDLVERYMQVTVGDGAPQTVYFRNTFCWDTFKNVIVDVHLKKGVNSIAFTNDNSYKFSSVQDDFAPRLDCFMVMPAMADLFSGAITSDGEETKNVSDSQTKENDKKENDKKENDKKESEKKNNKGGKIAKIKKQAKKIKVRMTGLRKKNKGILVKWKKNGKADGYQICVATDKKFKKVRTYLIPKNKVTQKLIRKVKKKKTYYVRIRAFKKYQNKYYYGKYSKYKKIKS